ncbi:hypothetical protein AB0M86_48555 [Streptomyces sp. NPDC051639]|uniref:hypothetical protein n=1 Tax=unclassified Streptomyces TaxID=2593676 RepID=UPI002E30658F|nr:hypothetical protein [Streptomyces sp. NBC_01455]
MGGEIEAHGAVTGENSTSKGSAEASPAPSTEDGFSWRRLAGQVAGAAVVVAVAADRLGLHFFLLLARFVVHAYSWLGLGS